MNTKFAASPDGTRIAYDVQGQGPALMLVHGYSVNRLTWHEIGWVNQLMPEFRVITVDLRGRGESDKPTGAAAYTIENMRQDLLAVADECAATEFSLWGHSWGATIALQMGAACRRVQRVIAAGTVFGKVFTEEATARFVSEMENALQARYRGKLTGLTLIERFYANRNDLPILIASCLGSAGWPPTEPADLLCPTLIYAGTAYEAATNDILARKETFEQTGVQSALLEGLTHLQEITEVKKVAPLVMPFLRSAIPNKIAQE
jgi:pimeloyl-ACP methyl ester carboxylesterase